MQELDSELQGHRAYYFMSWMVGLKPDSEQTAEAVEWYRKTYDNARGRYTRFRWGSIYLRKVMELGQLASAYETWNEDGRHDERVNRIRDFVQAECGRYPDGDDSQRSRCTEFLETAPPT